MNGDTKCQARFLRYGSWSSIQCRNTAVTKAGYCRVHDPDLAAERRKAKPTKFERRWFARKMVEEAIEKKMGALWLKAIHMAYSEIGDVPHPLPDWFVQLCKDKETQ